MASHPIALIHQFQDGELVVDMAMLILLLLVPDSVVYSPSSKAIRFAHDQSVHRSIPCGDCHLDITRSIRATDGHRAVEKTCSGCHAEWIQTKAQRCGSCHINYPKVPLPTPGKRSAMPRPKQGKSTTARLQFSHRLHHQRGIPCQTCHGMNQAANTREGGTTPTMPTMKTCVDCHRERGASTRCDACHPTRPDGVLQTRLPRGLMKPSLRVLPTAHHGLDFGRNHGQAARVSPTLCTTCHRDTQCAGCHAGHRRPVSIHPADYTHQHSVDARRDRPQCSGCHQPQRFCLNCHARSGVTMSPGSDLRKQPRGPRQFHPPGFVTQGGAKPGARHHGRAARRNLRTCVSCHQEADCVRCHSTVSPSSLRASPHPPHFRCDRLFDVNIKGCLKCHQDRGSLRRACDKR